MKPNPADPLERFNDLQRQGFMKQSRSRSRKPDAPTIACDDCLNWHPKGKHTADAAARKANRMARRQKERLPREPSVPSRNTAADILDRLLEKWWRTAQPGEAPRMQRFATKHRRRLLALARPLAERGQPQIMPRDDAPLWRRLADVIDSLDYNERLEFIYEGRHQVTPKWAGPGFVTMDAIGNASQEWPDAKAAAEHIVNLLGTRRARELAEAWEAGRTRVAVDEDGARSYVTPADDLARAQSKRRTSHDIFKGSFDLIPARASLDLPPVPSSPSMRDFDDAQSWAINADPWTNRGVAEIWRAEAVRWRRSNPGEPLDLDAIARATAAVVFERQRKDLAS